MFQSMGGLLSPCLGGSISVGEQPMCVAATCSFRGVGDLWSTHNLCSCQGPRVVKFLRATLALQEQWSHLEGVVVRYSLGMEVAEPSGLPW